MGRPSVIVTNAKIFNMSTGFIGFITGDTIYENVSEIR